MSVSRDSEGSNPKQGFWPELTRKSEARVIAESMLLVKNSAFRTHLPSHPVCSCRMLEDNVL